MTTPLVATSRHGHPLTWRAQFSNDVLRGLARSQKEIPCKYFYDEIGSALFDEICALDEYYLTRTELAILEAHAPEMGAAIGEDCELIELGSGSGVKTRTLLEHVAAPRAYVPIDVAWQPIERSARALAERFPGLLVLPVHADFTSDLSLPSTGEPPARRVVYFPGSTIGNFGPRAAVRLLGAIARLVGRGGGLLIGFDLDKDYSLVWAAYNDRRAVTAAFNLNLLARVNRELDADFDLGAFAHRASYFRAKERVEMHLVSRSAQLVKIGGLEFAFEQDETIRTECSYKYTPEHFGRLTSQAGFTLSRQWLDPQAYFSVQYLLVD
jgi:dimethylhistidine N-methyltransferase